MGISTVPLNDELVQNPSVWGLVAGKHDWECLGALRDLHWSQKSGRVPTERLRTWGGAWRTLLVLSWTGRVSPSPPSTTGTSVVKSGEALGRPVKVGGPPLLRDPAHSRL